MLSIYVEYLITELLKAHGGKLVSVMEPEIRALVQVAVDQVVAAQRERDAQAVIGAANNLPADADDGFYAGYKQAITQAIAAIRAQP